MIGTVIRIGMLGLLRDRIAMILTFLLPLVFFSVFAEVFGGLDPGNNRKVSAIISFEEDTPGTMRLRELLESTREVRWIKPEASQEEQPRTQLRDQIGRGVADVGILVPAGFSAKLGKPETGTPEVELFVNQANPMAAPLAEGLLQAAALTLAVEKIAPAGFVQEGDNELKSLIKIKTDQSTMGEGKKPSVAFFASGIGVMFLLFSLSGRSAILIEERENGVLTRLLASKLSLEKLILGRWCFLSLLGIFQISVMFVWASVGFGLELWTLRHLTGFFCLSLVTSAAAAGLGVLLAVSCQSRSQLNGIASVLILTMSVLGGSMFPRFLMSETMQQIGRFTFNAWALDGFQKVFWYEAKPTDLFPEMGIMIGSCLVFLALASMVARLTAHRRNQA